jgi:4-carboxymuconolactone decarboxylase
MTREATTGATLTHLDDATRALVRLSAALAAGDEESVRGELQFAASTTPHEWIEELLLQTYLFAGFPRALNGMREWRRIAPEPAPATLKASAKDLVKAGERTCAIVYGEMYDRLRENIATLHPRLDDWMIAEGYGKVLSRTALDLQRRELCIVAACAASGQDRQLQSHLHGARNVGVPESTIADALDALHGVVAAPLLERGKRLWSRLVA